MSMTTNWICPNGHSNQEVRNSHQRDAWKPVCGECGAEGERGKRRANVLEVSVLVQQVKAYAYEHYDKGGWDILVECHSDDEIAGWIGKPMTRMGAIRKVAHESGIGIVDERRREVQAEIF